MHERTSKLKQLIRNARSVKEKVSILKNYYNGIDCVILTAGPSINDYPIDTIRKFCNGKVIIAVKQTINILPDLVDFHLINPDNYQKYSSNTNNSIKLKVASDDSNTTPGFCEDILFLIDKNSIGKREKSVAATLEFEKYRLDKSTIRPWGPGIMYELGIYLPLLLGCSTIYVLGWDLGTPGSQSINRYYDSNIKNKRIDIFKEYLPNIYNKYLLRFVNKYNRFMFRFRDDIIINRPIITNNEALFIKNSTYDIYLWLQSHKHSLYLISDKSMVDKRIPRIDI